MNLALKEIYESFEVDADFLSAEPYGSGHINQTFQVKTDSTQSYLLQKINHGIFKNVPKLIENIVRVTTHLREKIRSNGGDPDRETLTLIPSKQGQFFIQDPEGGYWRMYLFIDSTRSYDVVTTALQAFEGGKAFGRFQGLLDDLPGAPLFETIPHFHDIDSRYEFFLKAVNEDVFNRLSGLKSEIDFVMKNYPNLREVLLLGKAEKIPLRVTHNDTKFNNVLLDENDKGLCVIDLDTVMPGYIHYDFSDTVRTATNTAAEDEADLSKIDMNFGLFEAYSEGFLSQVGPKLCSEEWASLGRSAKLLPFIIGLRFLTDYLSGDTYFKIKFPEHNLQRARAQFQLMRQIEKRESGIMKWMSALEKKYGRV